MVFDVSATCDATAPAVRLLLTQPRDSVGNPPPTRDDLGMAYKIWTEGRRFPILHVEPVLSDGERTHGHGPFSADRELIEELVALCIARCHASRRSAAERADGRYLAAAVSDPAARRSDRAGGADRLLQDGDEQPMRSFIAHPRHLRARPLPGESWDLAA